MSRLTKKTLQRQHKVNRFFLISFPNYWPRIESTISRRRLAIPSSSFFRNITIPPRSRFFHPSFFIGHTWTRLQLPYRIAIWNPRTGSSTLSRTVHCRPFLFLFLSYTYLIQHDRHRYRRKGIMDSIVLRKPTCVTGTCSRKLVVCLFFLSLYYAQSLSHY